MTRTWARASRRRQPEPVPRSSTPAVSPGGRALTALLATDARYARHLDQGAHA